MTPHPTPPFGKARALACRHHPPSSGRHAPSGRQCSDVILPPHLLALRVVEVHVAVRVRALYPLVQGLRVLRPEKHGLGPAALPVVLILRVSVSVIVIVIELGPAALPVVLILRV